MAIDEFIKEYHKQVSGLLKDENEKSLKIVSLTSTLFTAGIVSIGIIASFGSKDTNYLRFIAPLALFTIMLLFPLTLSITSLFDTLYYPIGINRLFWIPLYLINYLFIKTTPQEAVNLFLLKKSLQFYDKQYYMYNKNSEELSKLYYNYNKINDTLLEDLNIKDTGWIGLNWIKKKKIKKFQEDPIFKSNKDKFFTSLRNNLEEFNKKFDKFTLDPIDEKLINRELKKDIIWKNYLIKSRFKLRVGAIESLVLSFIIPLILLFIIISPDLFIPIVGIILILIFIFGFLQNYIFKKLKKLST